MTEDTQVGKERKEHKGLTSALSPEREDPSAISREWCPWHFGLIVYSPGEERSRVN